MDAPIVDNSALISRAVIVEISGPFEANVRLVVHRLLLANAGHDWKAWMPGDAMLIKRRARRAKRLFIAYLAARFSRGPLDEG